jgi:hypothetical protein
MNAPTASTILISLAAGGLCGYLSCAHHPNSSFTRSTRDVFSDEYVTPPDTFSRIKNIRNSLDSLGTRVALGMTGTLAAYDGLPRTSESERRKAEQVLERTIDSGEAAMQEFQGTQQEPVVAQAFLRALRKAGRFNRWVDVYLKQVYTHPTDPIVCDLANEAIKISRMVGQQQRVLEALSHVIASPIEFAGRTEVQTALTSAICLSQCR